MSKQIKNVFSRVLLSSSHDLKTARGKYLIKGELLYSLRLAGVDAVNLLWNGFVFDDNKSLKNNKLPDAIVDVRAENAGLRATLINLLRASKFYFQVHKSITNEEKITLNLSGKTWREAFHIIVRRAHLQYEIKRTRTLYVKKL